MFLCIMSAESAMKQQPLDPDQSRFRQLDDEAQQLLVRKNAVDETYKRIEAAQAEANSTLPPSDIVQWIEDSRLHAETIRKTGAENHRREYKCDGMLLALLVSSIVTLLWWAWRSMHGM